MNDTIYGFKVTTIQGVDKPLDAYKGQVLLIVNTASKCGFTPQLEGLESLYSEYKDKGVSILGFPCNQFGQQDPGSDSEISEFCELNYGVNFPMFSKIEVNGDNAHPLFEHLKTQAPGFAGTKSIKWNFTKFLVDQNGQVVKRFAPKDKPVVIEKAIKALLV